MVLGSQLRSPGVAAPDDQPPAGFRLAVVPALLGLVALLNVLSVVLALLE